MTMCEDQISKIIKDCEDLLLSIYVTIKNNPSAGGRVYRFVIEQTYRSWTDALTMRYKNGVNLWSVEDENTIIHDPSTIPLILSSKEQYLHPKNTSNVN